MPKLGRKATAAEAPPARDARAVLFPRGRDVPLSAGGSVTVRPWSVRLLVEVSQRLPEQMTDILAGVQADPTAPAATLLPRAIDEIRWLVARTLDCAEADLEEWSAEDLFDVAAAVWDVCIQPVAEKILGLVQRVMAKALPAVVSSVTTRAGPSQPPPSS